MIDPVKAVAWIAVIIAALAFWILAGAVAYALIWHLSR